MSDCLTGNELRALEGSTITRVKATGDDNEGTLWALQLSTGQVYMVLADWDGNVSIHRDDRPGIWF